MTDFFN